MTLQEKLKQIPRPAQVPDHHVERIYGEPVRFLMGLGMNEDEAVRELARRVQTGQVEVK